MKKSVKTKKRSSVPRDLFAELSEGMEALAEARQGKRTLRTHAVEYKPAPTVTPQELIRVRKDLKISRALFAVYLRTNVRTLENWEQGRARPNAQAALLINLVKRYPNTVARLATIQPDCSVDQYIVVIDSDNDLECLRPEHLLKGALDSTAACRPENGILRQLSLSPEGHRLPPDVNGPGGR